MVILQHEAPIYVPHTHTHIRVSFVLYLSPTNTESQCRRMVCTRNRETSFYLFLYHGVSRRLTFGKIERSKIYNADYL